MVGLGAKEAHFASRKENTALMGSRFNIESFCLSIRHLEDRDTLFHLVLCNAVGKLFFLRMRWLCPSPWLDTLPPEMEGQLVYPPRHAAKRVGATCWGGPHLLMCCHTGQRGSRISPQCCECNLARSSWLFIQIQTQLSSSPVTAPRRCSFFLTDQS